MINGIFNEIRHLRAHNYMHMTIFMVANYLRAMLHNLRRKIIIYGGHGDPTWRKVDQSFVITKTFQDRSKRLQSITILLGNMFPFQPVRLND